MLDLIRNLIPVAGKHIKQVGEEISNIKSPDFLRPVAGKYLFKREKKPVMNFPVSEQKIQQMKEMGLFKPTLVPSIKTRPITEVIKSTYEREGLPIKLKEQQYYTKKHPERWEQIKKHIPSLVVPGQEEELVKKGVLTPEESKLFTTLQVWPEWGGLRFLSTDEAARVVAKYVSSKLTRKDLIDITRGVMKDKNKLNAFKRMARDPKLKKELINIAKNEKVPLRKKIIDYLKESIKEITPKVEKKAPTEEGLPLGSLKELPGYVEEQVSLGGLSIKKKVPVEKVGEIQKSYTLPWQYEPAKGKPTWKHGKLLWNTIRNKPSTPNVFKRDMTNDKGFISWVISKLSGEDADLVKLQKRFEGQRITRKQYKKLYALFKNRSYSLDGYREVVAKLKGIEPNIIERIKPEVETKIKTEIPKELEPLVKEARKYKSAEEFVKAFYPKHALDISKPELHNFGRLKDIAESPDDYPNLIQFKKEYDKPVSGLNEWQIIWRGYTGELGYPEPDLTKSITIYRALPREKEIRPGDWVALTKEYAEKHLKSGSVIKKMKVSPKDVRWAGTDPQEWIYAPHKMIKLMKEIEPKSFYNQVVKGVKEAKIPKELEFIKSKKQLNPLAPTYNIIWKGKKVGEISYRSDEWMPKDIKLKRKQGFSMQQIKEVVENSKGVIRLDDIFIRPEYRQKGLGTMVIKKIFEENPNIRKIRFQTPDKIPEFWIKLGAEGGRLEAYLTRKNFYKYLSVRNIKDKWQKISGYPIKSLDIAEKYYPGTKRRKILPKEKAIIPYELKLPKGEPILGGRKTTRATSIKRLREELRKARGEKSVQEIKQELVNYARKNIPLPVRGKLLAQVKNVKTKSDLEKAISLAEKYREKFIQKQLREKIIKELKTAKAKVREGILRGKYTADIQRKLNKIYASALAGDRNLAREKIAENIQLYHEGKIGYDEMREQNEILSMTGIKGMTSKELKYVLDNIKSIKKTGKTLREIKDFNEQTRIQRLKDKFIDIITGGKGIKKGTLSLPGETLEYGEKGITGRIQRAWLKVRNWQFGWDNILDVLSRFDKSSKPYQSLLSKFGQNVHKARDLQNVGERKYLKKVQDKAMEIFKAKNRRELNSILSKLKNEKVNLGTFKNLDGEKVKLELTKEQIMQKYLEMQDPTLLDTFKEGMRWTDEMMEAIKKSLTPQEKEWAEWHKEFYQEYYNTINSVYREIYGVDLPRNPNYVPIGRDIEANIPEDVLVAKELSRYASVVNGHLKARVKTRLPLKFNELDSVLVNHIIQMEHFKAWAKTMRDLRRVFGDKEIRTAIRQYHGQDILKTIDGYLNDMARDGIDRMKIVKGVDILRRNFTRAVLGVKPAIALKQIGSVLAYTTEMSIRDFIEGVADFWKHPIENYRFLLEKSPYLRTRFEKGFERDIKFAMKKGWTKQIANTKDISDWLMALIRGGDKFAVIQGSWAKYKSALKEGKSIQEAIEEAEQLTRRTQPTFDLETLSPLQKGGSWMKLFTMFQNQPNKYFRIIADNVRNFKAGRGSKIKAIYNIVLAWVVLPSIFQFMADAFHFRKKHQLRAIVLGPVNDFLVVGQMAQSIYGWLTNEPFEYEASPVFSTMDDLQKAITKTTKLVNPARGITTDDFIEAVEYYGKAIGQLTGIPTPYIIQAERAIRRGKPEELIFSPYSLGKTLRKNKSRSKYGVDWDKVFGKKKTSSRYGVDWDKVFSK